MKDAIFCILLVMFFLGIWLNLLQIMTFISFDEYKYDVPTQLNTDNNSFSFTSNTTTTTTTTTIINNNSHHDKNNTNTNNNKNNKNIRISYTLHYSYNNIYNDTYNPVRCAIGKNTVVVGKGFNRQYSSRYDLSSNFKNIPGLFDFTTTIHLQNNFKLLVVGDSVAMQFVQGLYESAGIQNTTFTYNVIREEWPKHDGQSIGRTIIPRGGTGTGGGTGTNHNHNNKKEAKEDDEETEEVGGIIAGYRITALLSRKMEGKYRPNTVGGGWERQHVLSMMNHEFLQQPQQKQQLQQQQQLSSSSSTTQKPFFDTVLYRIPHGWMKLNEITISAIQETIDLVYELFGATTIIFTLIPFSNNIQTLDEYKKAKQINNQIRNFAFNYSNKYNNNNNKGPNSSTSSSGSGGGVQYVLVQEFDIFVHDFIKRNAEIIGMKNAVVKKVEEDDNDNNNDNDNDDISYMLKRLNFPPRYPPSIAHTCNSNITNNNNKICDRNYFSIDGMHYCMKTIGGRYFANVACLLGCVYNNNDNNLNLTSRRMHHHQQQQIHNCAKDCNTQYMSLQPINVTTIGIPQYSSSSR